jgi:hypothetical protein
MMIIIMLTTMTNTSMRRIMKTITPKLMAAV